MPNLTRDQLFGKIVDAVTASGWNALHSSGNEDHPFRVQAYRGDDSVRIRAYIWNISHGGGNMRPANEYRIQVHVPRFLPEEGWNTLILGWWDEGQVFAGFDYRKHAGELGQSASIQIRLDALENAVINDFALCDKGNQETAVAFRPELFVEYAKNSVSFHSFGELRQDLDVLQTISQDVEQIQNNELTDLISPPRKRDFQLISKALRDNSFTKRILNAYSHRCAFCDVQLNLIEAAHIIPVSAPNSTDETRNGIALCSNHHKAYDHALITFTDTYRIISSEVNQQSLRLKNHHGKLEGFLADLKPLINVPPAIRDRPLVQYVNTANQLRGW